MSKCGSTATHSQALILIVGLEITIIIIIIIVCDFGFLGCQFFISQALEHRAVYDNINRSYTLYFKVKV